MKGYVMKKILLTAAFTMLTSTAYATPVTFFDTISGGQTSFTNTVTGTGASVATQNLSGLSYASSWSFADFTISNTDGGNAGIYGASADGTTGDMITINPTKTNPETSGITFTFNSAINAIGFEVGDWGTCCTPSSLYISFDGGSTQTVGTAYSYSDNPSVAAGLPKDGIFVGAIDDTSTFTTITFYGDGYGEVLTAGGTIYYSSVAIGSVGEVPVPAAAFLFGPALLGFMGLRRKAKKA
jgi:hypothetical protein